MQLECNQSGEKTSLEQVSLEANVIVDHPPVPTHADRELLASAIRDLTEAIALSELGPADVPLARELLSLLSAAAARHALAEIEECAVV
jgi:hypothetical protein